MATKNSKDCKELKDIPREVDEFDHAIKVANSARRGKDVLEILAPMVSLVEVDEHPQLRIEPITPGLLTLTSDEVMTIKERFSQVNSAIRNGDIGVTAGLTSVKLINREAAINALTPGVFTPQALQCGTMSQGMAFVSRVLVEENLKQGQLINVLDYAYDNPRTLYLVAPSHHFSWPKVKRFESWLKSLFLSRRAS